MNSRENSPRETYRVDSPEKRIDTCTPDDTSRSFSSQRNDGSPSLLHHHHSDSVDSQSPENLTSSKSQLCASNNISVNDMLDHKLQLSFLGPPLAALHSMTEMKSQNSPKASQNSKCVTNPHGIDSILSRQTPVTSAHLNAALGGELFSVSGSKFFKRTSFNKRNASVLNSCCCGKYGAVFIAKSKCIYEGSFGTSRRKNASLLARITRLSFKSNGVA